MGSGSHITPINPQLIESQRLRCVHVRTSGAPTPRVLCPRQDWSRSGRLGEAWLLQPPPLGQGPVLQQSTRNSGIFLQCQVPDAPSRRGCRVHSLLLRGWGAAASLSPSSLRTGQVNWDAGQMQRSGRANCARTPGTVRSQKPDIPLWGFSSL